VIQTENALACPVCGSFGEAKFSDVTDWLFGVEGNWNVTSCNSKSCDALWLNPRPSESNVEKLYERYHTHDTGFGVSRLPASLRRLIKNEGLIPDSLLPGRILEVGCGNGRYLAKLSEAGWSVNGQEVDTLAAEAAEQLLGFPIFRRTLEECSIEENSYNVVLLNHVVEHLFDPVRTLRTIRSILVPGGVCIFYTPNSFSASALIFGKRWRGLEVPRHFQILGPKSAATLLRQSGFEDVELTTIAHGGAGVARRSFVHKALPLPLTAFLHLAFGVLEYSVARLMTNRGWQLRVIAKKPA
jgi:2-polyprenyl-3-methyl-5-hydroxy-6-metoxy-1,4-benzoquinol methylase